MSNSYACAAPGSSAATASSSTAAARVLCCRILRAARLVLPTEGWWVVGFQALPQSSYTLDGTCTATDRCPGRSVKSLFSAPPAAKLLRAV
jgi:hypothetical protein